MKPLRVAIDISAIPFGRGVSRYTQNIVTALAAQPNVELSLFGAVSKHWLRLQSWARGLRGQPAVRFLPLPTRWLEKLWKITGQPSLSLLSRDADVVHVWEWQLPPLARKPWVVTIHDLAHLLYPETALPDITRRFDIVLRRLEEDTSAEIITVSNSTKNDILRLTQIEASRITVIEEALPEQARYQPSQSEVEDVLQRFGLDKPYFLCIGTSEPRKNLPRVVQAWQKASRAAGYDLVLVGDKGWDELPTLPGLHHLGYQPGEVTSALYRRATGLVFPSLYEGFGLPVLEAFYHDCPVITSRVSSLPEVAGDAAILVDPYSVPEISEAMTQLQNLTESQRVKLQSKMSTQLGKFSWDRAAEQTLKVYRKAARV